MISSLFISLTVILSVSTSNSFLVSVLRFCFSLPWHGKANFIYGIFRVELFKKLHNFINQSEAIKELFFDEICSLGIIHSGNIKTINVKKQLIVENKKYYNNKINTYKIIFKKQSHYYKVLNKNFYTIMPFIGSLIVFTEIINLIQLKTVKLIKHSSISL